MAPRRMFDHQLNPLKGWPNESAVDFSAKLSSNVTIDPVYAGRVVHLNSSGEYEMGLPNTVGAGHMPLFLFQNSDDPDVTDDGGDPDTDVLAWVPTNRGNMMALVAIGGYELQSTEFQAESDVGTYTPGTTLTATNSNSNATTGGRITKGTAYSAPLCGVVSRGVTTNAHRKSVLSFWPVWLPRQS